MLDSTPLGTEAFVAPPENARQFTVLKGGEDIAYCLISGEERIAESSQLSAILEQFACGLMVHVTDNAPDHVFLHAGVVGWQRRALILPGDSFAGKTTLVAELVRAGATYYSDEYAVIDDCGWVHPYARKLRMRAPGRTEQTPVEVERLNGVAGVAPLPVAMVAFTEYVESGRWLPEAISPGMAALEMLRHAIPVRRTPARVMTVLAKVIETAQTVRSERGEARDAAQLLLVAMSASRGPA